jgi:hypothetical protein
MKKQIFIFGCLLATVLFSCKKASHQDTGNNSSLTGKWILVLSLADPGDGSGKWTATDKPGFYFLQLDTDSTVETNCFTGLGGARNFSVINNSVIRFTYAHGQTMTYGYRLANDSLTITGGCIEACGVKFIRG